MNNFQVFNNKDGSLTTYAFACGHIERTAFDNDGKKIEMRPVPIVDNRVDLYGENMSTSLYSIKVFINDNMTWLQRTGLKNARKCANAAKTIVKKFLTGKLTYDEAMSRVNALGFEESDED